jgi:hypothetical protein
VPDTLATPESQRGQPAASTRTAQTSSGDASIVADASKWFTAHPLSVTHELP